MNCRRLIESTFISAVTLLTLTTAALADPVGPGKPAPLPFDPDQSHGPSFQPWVDPNGFGGRVHGPGSDGTPGAAPRGPRAGPSVPDAFVQLVGSLAQNACGGNRDTIIWEQPVGATNGFTCVEGSVDPGTPDSLGSAAAFGERFVAWPAIAIAANPDNPATVAIPTYYWVTGYDGRPLPARASVILQEGERCHEVSESDPDNPDGPPITRRICVPNWVNYTLTVTARASSFVWSFEDDKSVVSKFGPDGLGTPYQAPAWSSPIVHLFNISSLKKEAQGGFTISLTITYVVEWVADAATGQHHSGTLRPVPQTVSRPQHVREIQVVRGDRVSGGQP